MPMHYDVETPPTQREATPPAESVANQEEAEAELADFDKDFFGFELSEEELGGVNLNDVMTCNPYPHASHVIA